MNLKIYTMKYVGFIKELDELSFANEFKSCFTNIYRDNSDVVESLDKGVSFASWIDYVSEIEDIEILIAPFKYFTDGKWIWPVYFSYYLKKKTIIFTSLLSF